MKMRRSLTIVLGILLVFGVAYFGTSGPLEGSLLSGKQIARTLKSRADNDASGTLATREVRSTLISILRGVAMRKSTEDINGDGVVDQADIRATTQAFRALLAASCGNGRIDVDEDCDDGNTANADGCTSMCLMEPRYRCTGEPSSCVELTGDEYVRVSLKTMQNGTANAGDTVPLMRLSIDLFPNVSPAPQTVSLAVTMNRGVINDLVSLTAYEDTDGDGQYESQIGDPVASQNVLGSLFFFMEQLPIGESESPADIELRGTLAPRVIVREMSLKFPDPRLFASTADTALVRFDGALPDQAEASLNGYCRLTTKVCPVRITTDGGSVAYYSIKNPPCGSGTLDAGETCDDGNVNAGDGCDASCHVEDRYACSGTPSVCVHDCGNGICAADETSLLLPGHQGPPYVCPEDCGTCGDGEIMSVEKCDDRNQYSGDGCSNVCAIEPGYRCTGSPSECTDTVSMETLDAKMPIPLKEFGLAWDQVGRKAYIFGGESKNENSILHPRSVIMFDAAAEAFMTKDAQIPEGGLWNTSAVWDSLRRKAYVFGGYSERTSAGSDPIHMSAGIYEYDPETDTFGIVAALPTVRFWVSPVYDTKRNLIYAIGGTRGYKQLPGQEPFTDVVSEIVRFDPGTRQITTIPFPLPGIGTIKDPAVYDPDTDKVYIFGYHGQDYTYNQGVFVHEFDPATGAVTFLENVSLPAQQGAGTYLGFSVFWDTRERAIRLVGGAMYNSFYEPGASRFNDTYNYTFHSTTHEFTRWINTPAHNMLEEMRRYGGFFYDESVNAFTVLGGIPNKFQWDQATDTVQKFSF